MQGSKLTPTLVMVCAISMLQQASMLGSRPLVSLYLTERGLSLASIGIVAAAWSFAPAILGIVAGAWTDQFGTRTVLLVSLPLVALSSALIPATPALGLFMPFLLTFGLIQVMSGVGHSGAQVATQKAAAWAGPGGFDYNFGLLSFASSLGQTLGPALSGWAVELGGWTAAFMVTAAAGVVAMILAIRLPRGQEGPGPQHTGMGSTVALLRLGRVRTAVLASVLVLMAFDTLVIFFPVYGESLALSPGAIGLLLAVRGAASMVVRPLLGVAVRRFGRMNTIIAVLLIAALGLLGISLAPSIPRLIVIMVMLGVAIGLGAPATMSEVAEAAPSGKQGGALGIRVAGNRASQLVAPVVLGALATSQVHLAFTVAGALLGVMASSMVLRRWLARRQVPGGS